MRFIVSLMETGEIWNLCWTKLMDSSLLIFTVLLPFGFFDLENSGSEFDALSG